MSSKFFESIRPALLPSLSAFSAAWMVVMGTRYFSLQAADVNGAMLVGVDSGSWLSTAYSIAEVLGVLFGTWLGIALSLRRMLLIGVSIYLFGSLIPLLFPGYSPLMASRIITGLAGGAIMPQAIIVQLRTWGPARSPVAIALYLSAPTAAPLLGGVIGAWGVEHFGWSAVLWAAFPLGMLSLITGAIGLQREPIKWRPIIHADVAGFISLGAALAMFVCAISQGDRMRWFQTPMIPALFLASALCLAVFIFREWRHIRHPALWVKLYGRWNIALALIGVVPLTLAINYSGVIIPSALAQLRGFRPEQIAPVLWTACWPQALSYAACAYIVMKKLIEPRKMVVMGFATVAIGAFFNLEITSQWESAELYVGQLIQGIGLPLIALPMIYQFTGDLRPPLEAIPAAGVFNFSRTVGGAISAAWATTSIRLDSQEKFGEVLSNTGFYPDGRGTWITSLTKHISLHDPDPLRAKAEAVQVLAGTVRRQAAVLGISDTLATLGWMLFASCILIILMAEFGWGKALRPHEKRS